MKKKIILAITTICCIIAMYILLHITPALALRTYLFTDGHPIIALTTGIVDDEYHNRVDKKILEHQNAKSYILTKPATDQPTQYIMIEFKVVKKGILYFAQPYGEA